jgi:hypothetical protein
MKIIYKALLIIAAILVALVIIQGVFAATWPLTKPVTCSVLNLTTDACDIFWCNSVIGCEYNLTLSACICREIINETMFNCTANSTISYAINNTDYYNKTEIGVIISGNITEAKSNMSSYADSKDMSLRDSLADRFDRIESDLSNIGGTAAPAKDIPYTFIGLVVIVVAALVGFGVWTKVKEKDKKLSQTRSKSGLTYGDPDDYYGEEDKEEDMKSMEEKPKDRDKKKKSDKEEEIET